MNVFRPAASDRQWLPDKPTITNGENAGGDAQVGKSFCVRFRRADRPCAMITRTAYSVSAEDDGEERVIVRVQTEWLVGTDPDDLSGTEQWSDRIDKYAAGPYRSVAETEDTARNVARELLHDVDSLAWDGLPPWGNSDD